MAPSAPTTVIFVPGAWHNASCFDISAWLLRQADYDTSYVTLPSVGPAEYPKDWSADVKKIREHIQAAVNKGHRIVLVVHSYGGLPANEAVKGLDLETRQKAGQSGGVAHIFFCCSFVIPEGKSLTQAFGGTDLPWFVISEDKLEVRPITPAETFYNDLPKDQIDALVTALKPHSYQCFHTPVTYAAWKHVPSTYLYCLQDQAIPLQVQKLMVEVWAKEVHIKTESLDASHSPFLSQPQAVANSIRRAAGEML